MNLKFGPIDFTQPSTWRGILGIAGVFGLAVSPELANQIALAVGTGLSLIEMLRNEYAQKSIKQPAQIIEQPAQDYAQSMLSATATAADKPVTHNPVRVQQPLLSDAETTQPPDSNPPGFGNR